MSVISKVMEKTAEHAGPLADAATKASYTASASAIGVGGLTLNEWAAIAGIAGVGLTYVTNLVFRVVEHRARMRRLALGMKTDTGLQDL